MKRWRAAFSLLIILLLSGCWDIRNIENFNFVTALGIDYAGGEYVIYSQYIDLSKFAKQESGSSGLGHGNIMTIGKAKGKTLNQAMDELYRSSQQATSWSQVKTIIFSKNALKQGILTIHEQLMRNRDIRYNAWIFATEDPVDEMLMIKPVAVSTYMTLMYLPERLHNQRSFVQYLNLQQTVRSTREPADTVIIPSIKKVAVWKKDSVGKIDSVAINGGYALIKGKVEHWFSEDELRGLRWLNEKTVQTPLPVEDNNLPVAMVMLRKPKIKLDIRERSGKQVININVGINGDVRELIEPVEFERLNQLVKDKVADEIRSTFRKCQDEKVDAYAFEQVFYRKHLRQWKNMKQEDSGPLINRMELGDLKVDVSIRHSQMFKYKVKR